MALTFSLLCLSVAFLLTTGAPHFITSLNIRNSNIGPEGFEPVCKLGHLRILTLYNCPKITSDMLASMRCISSLHALDLDSCAHVCSVLS